MKININLDEDEVKPTKLCTKIIKSLSYLSIWNCLWALTALLVVTVCLYVCKTYTAIVLEWLEYQNSTVICVTIIILFTIISFPISLGYIVLVIATGYLFGMLKGLALTALGANIGLLIAHSILKTIKYSKYVSRLVRNETSQAIMRVISGPMCFKIIFCARLTPIPFGLQNMIFALSNVNGRIYHTASLLGLFPGQFVGIYVGSSLRSMQDVLENRQISTPTYAFAVAQLAFGTGLMVWLGTKARKELVNALTEAEMINGSLSGLSII